MDKVRLERFDLTLWSGVSLRKNNLDLKDANSFITKNTDLPFTSSVRLYDSKTIFKRVFDVGVLCVLDTGFHV